MATEADINDDEYVANLLAKDARDSSIKYSAMGLAAYMPKRPTNAAPRPNKRFLTNLIRETDSHNAALKKKEELEARMRLRGEQLSSSRSGRDNAYQEGRERKRMRVEDSREHKSRRSHDHPDEREDDFKHDRHRRRSHRGTAESYDDRHHESRRHSHRARHGDYRQRSHGRSRRRDRSSSVSDGKPTGHDRQRYRRRSTSISSCSSDERDRKKPRRDKCHASRRKHRRDAEASRSRSRSLTPPRKRNGDTSDIKFSKDKTNRPSPSDSDSDPLESLVGPLPPPAKNLPVNDPPPLTSRGRGAFRPFASTMDAHFSSSYDPTVDVRPESENENEREDWDMALEAMRDRELWKKKGAERLRGAGFGDEEIKKWEDSGRERGIEDVRWSSRGEAREWDRGKVVETEGDKKGEIGLEAAWKRKDGGFMRSFKKALG